MTMNEDIKKYPCFVLYNNEIIPAPWIKDTRCYDHSIWELHHFVRKTIRKTNPAFYERVEYLQKLILIPKNMNYELESLGADTFAKRYPKLIKNNITKHDLVFSRLKWRENYYDTRDE